MRETCIECVAKHVGSALVLFSETIHGYPDHLILAVGELEQAVQECEFKYPGLSEQIRKVRKLAISLIPEILNVPEDDAKDKRYSLLAPFVPALAELRQQVFSTMLYEISQGHSIKPTENV